MKSTMGFSLRNGFVQLSSAEVLKIVDLRPWK